MSLASYQREAKVTVTREKFIAATGSTPVDDDDEDYLYHALEQANCALEGTFGHFSCGWCQHDKPYQHCSVCHLQRLANTKLRIVLQDSTREEFGIA